MMLRGSGHVQVNEAWLPSLLSAPHLVKLHADCGAALRAVGMAYKAALVVVDFQEDFCPPVGCYISCQDLIQSILTLSARTVPWQCKMQEISRPQSKPFSTSPSP